MMVKGLLIRQAEMEMCSRGFPIICPHTHSRRGLWKAINWSPAQFKTYRCYALGCSGILVKKHTRPFTSQHLLWCAWLRCDWEWDSLWQSHCWVSIVCQLPVYGSAGNSSSLMDVTWPGILFRYPATCVQLVFSCWVWTAGRLVNAPVHLVCDSITTKCERPPST